MGDFCILPFCALKGNKFLWKGFHGTSDSNCFQNRESQKKQQRNESNLVDSLQPSNSRVCWCKRSHTEFMKILRFKYWSTHRTQLSYLTYSTDLFQQFYLSTKNIPLHDTLFQSESISLQRAEQPQAFGGVGEVCLEPVDDDTGGFEFRKATCWSTTSGDFRFAIEFIKVAPAPLRFGPAGWTPPWSKNKYKHQQ